MKRRKTHRQQCGKGIGTLFTTLVPKVLGVLGTKIIPALGLGAMEGLGRKMVGGRKKGRTLGKRTPCAMIRPHHLHKLKPYASMLRSKLNAKQNWCPEQRAHAQKSCHHPTDKESKRRIHLCHVGIPRHSHPHESPRDLIFCVHIFYLYHIKRV